jgi:phosphate uptake regulator
MGDHAEGIAKIALMLADEPPLKPYVDIPRMADIAREMLMDSLEAFKHRDTALARQVCNRDDEVDELYDRLYHELISYMIKDPANIQRATYLIWVTHNLERIGDRVTNICERVVYLVEGHIQEMNVSILVRAKPPWRLRPATAVSRPHRRHRLAERLHNRRIKLRPRAAAHLEASFTVMPRL